jgi:ABC-type proline/glycine betaine transport system ATPase subunit
LIKKNEVEKNIRVLNEQNSQSKRQIQQAFEELRQKIDMQEREILSRCDSQLNEAMV